MAGVLTGAAIAFTAIGAAGALFPKPDTPLPPPHDAPDYLATIQAPTPTTGPDPEQQSSVTSTTYVNEDDIKRLTQWMHSDAWLPAVAAASRSEPQRLLAILANRTVNQTCHGQLAEAVYRMAGAGQLLAPTHSLTDTAMECINAAIGYHPTADEYRNLGHAERAEAIARLLNHQSMASNPLTQQAAAEPSPQNIGYWRTIWPHQQHCRDAVPRMAAETAATDAPESAIARLERHFLWLTDCLSETPTATQEPPAVPAP